jgi:predicted nucleotidyltransferase
MHPDLLELLRLLRSHEVRFLVVGSTALAIHARPRFTEDIDLWLERTEQNTTRLAAALREFGISVEDRILQPFWKEDRQMITLGAKPQAIDLLNFLGNDSFDSAWSRKIGTRLEGIEVDVIGLEDFIRAKQVAGRPKDLADLEILKEVHGLLPDLD